MSFIRTVLLTGSAFYAILFIIQALQYQPAWIESLVGISIVGFLCALSFKTDEHELHSGEMILIWTCILLFALYALLRTGGII